MRGRSLAVGVGLAESVALRVQPPLQNFGEGSGGER